MADLPGGTSGLLARDYKGKDADHPVYRVDTHILALTARPRAAGCQELHQRKARGI
jgi:hypothetical protein